MLSNDPSIAILALKQGGVVAYPTEGVYGLGCDPQNPVAVEKILNLKQREKSQGLILIAANWAQLQPFVAEIPEKALSTVLSTWPGPITWIFPKSQRVPIWISGAHDTIAVRVTDHPIAKWLCEQLNSPLVSTSANPHGLAPAKTALDVKNYFGHQIEVIVQGQVGDLTKPTQMRNALTGEIIRP